VRDANHAEGPLDSMVALEDEPTDEIAQRRIGRAG
jgi:hypothetical protein